MVVQVVEAWGGGSGGGGGDGGGGGGGNGGGGDGGGGGGGVAMEATVAEGPMVEWEAMGAEDRGPDRRIRASTEQQRLW